MNHQLLSPLLLPLAEGARTELMHQQNHTLHPRSSLHLPGLRQMSAWTQLPAAVGWVQCLVTCIFLKLETHFQSYKSSHVSLYKHKVSVTAISGSGEGCMAPGHGESCGHYLLCHPQPWAGEEGWKQATSPL